MHHNTPLFDSDPTGTHHRRHPSLTIQPPTASSFYDDSRASPSSFPPLSNNNNNIFHNSYAGALASSSTLLPPPLAFDRQSQSHHRHPFRSTPLETTTTTATTLHNLSRSNGGGGGGIVGNGGLTLLGSTLGGGHHYRNISGSSGDGSKSNMMMYQQDSLGFSSALATSGGSGTTTTGSSPPINKNTTSGLKSNTTATRSFVELLKPHVKFVLAVLVVWMVYGGTFGEETTTMMLSLLYVLFTTLPDCLLRPKWVKMFIEPLPYRVVALAAARHGVTQAILFLEFAIVMDDTIPKVSDDAFTPIWTAFGASLLIQAYLLIKVAGSAAVFLRSPLFAWLARVLCMGSGILLRNVLQCTPCCPRTKSPNYINTSSCTGDLTSGGGGGLIFVHTYSTGSPPLSRDSSHSNFSGGGGGGEDGSGNVTAPISVRLMERLGRCRLDSTEELTRQFVQLLLQPAVTTCRGTHNGNTFNGGGGGGKTNQHHHHSCKTICEDVMVFVLPGFAATAFLYLRRVYRQGKIFIARRFQLLMALLLRPVLCGYHYRKRKESGCGASVSPGNGLVVSGGHQPNLLPSRSWSVLDVPQPVSTPLGGTSAASSSFRRQPISIATGGGGGGGGGTHQPSLGTAGSNNVLSSLAYERSPLMAPPPPFSPTSSVFHPPPASSPRVGLGGGGGSSFFSSIGGSSSSYCCCCVDCGVKNMKSRYNRLTAFRNLTRR